MYAVRQFSSIEDFEAGLNEMAARQMYLHDWKSADVITAVFVESKPVLFFDTSTLKEGKPCQ